MNIESSFEAQGTLEPPRMIGRLVRFLSGVLVLWWFYSEIDVAWAFITGTRYMDAVPPQNALFYFAVLFTLWAFPHVINIGFTKSWGRAPQIAIVALAGVAILWGVLIFGSWWAPPLEILLLVWMIYTFGHLGISFIISSFIATPGCEMRAIPHLWSKLTGIQTKEHFCPGPLDPIDRWERSLATKSET